MGILSDIAPAIDDILGIRDDLDLAKAVINLVSQYWASGKVGQGNCVETVTPFKPTPSIVDYSLSVYLSDVGVIKQGDLILKDVSKNLWNEDQVWCNPVLPQNDPGSVMNFFEVNGQLYIVIGVTSTYLMWNVHIRKRTNQKRYAR